MLNSSRSSAILFCLAIVLAFSNSACRVLTFQAEERKVVSAAPQAQPARASDTQISAKSPQPARLGNTYSLALDKAQSAKSMSQSVQTAEDWSLVANRWKQAIALLKQVSKTDPNKKLADQKLREYQQNLTQAQARATQVGKDKGATLDPGISVDTSIAENLVTSSGPGGTHRARIKYRQSRIPVIDVVFNGNRQFEMMVDTGASGTMITPDMAEELQATIVGTTIAMTPAGETEIAIGRIKSIQVGGHKVRNVQVAIGPVRLLGHDFFDRCDISIKQDVVEFQQCS
ncbi:MAG: aspartyl protease [Leptolyngbyaceae cyanobacterium CSU_1_3]|nr:aspartyl protease [Leptolyngbyaceae cyanobacterium CSU_1_3]